MAKKTITGETKAQKFIRLGNKRFTRIVKAIRGLGALSGRSYDWTPVQVDKLFNAITHEATVSRSRFNKDAKEREEISVL